MVLEPCEVCSTWRVEFTEPSGLANTHIYIELSYTIVNIVAKLEAITLPFSMEDSEYESLPTEKATVHLAAGALAGVMEHCVMYPVDCVKVRWDSILWWLLYLAKNINDFQSRFGSRQILLVFADHMVELFFARLATFKDCVKLDHRYYVVFGFVLGSPFFSCCSQIFQGGKLLVPFSFNCIHWVTHMFTWMFKSSIKVTIFLKVHPEKNWRFIQALIIITWIDFTIYPHLLAYELSELFSIFRSLRGEGNMQIRYGVFWNYSELPKMNFENLFIFIRKTVVQCLLI